MSMYLVQWRLTRELVTHSYRMLAEDYLLIPGIQWLSPMCLPVWISYAEVGAAIRTGCMRGSDHYARITDPWRVV
jgi:hypothetical protein